MDVVILVYLSLLTVISLDISMYVLYIHEIFLLKVDADLEIKAYYAGHVLGAAMFQVK